MKLKLYSYWRSTCSWRVRIALAWKGLPYQYEAINLLRDGGDQNTERYRALNPMRTVPMLELEEDGQVHRLAQSLAIIEFLEERFPSPPLLPKAPLVRARARQIAEMVNSGIQPLQNLSVYTRVKNELKGDDAAWNAYWIDRGLTAIEAVLAERPGKLCVGDEVSLADICLVPQLTNARRFAVDLSRFPNISRVEAACRELPAFQQAHPDRQPDAQAAK
jgi:maleylpyruvate isomerase